MSLTNNPTQAVGLLFLQAEINLLAKCSKMEHNDFHTKEVVMLMSQRRYEETLARLRRKEIDLDPDINFPAG